MGRLTTYTPPAALESGTYTWNGFPDRASIKIGSGDTVTTTFDAASRPTADSSGGTYASDGQGRLTAMPGKAMEYDALGRLTAVRDAGGTIIASYSYDALDRLRRVNEGGLITRLRYVGLSNAVAQEINDDTSAVLLNHATDAGGTLLRYYGRNDHTDVTWTSSSTGAVDDTAAYDPFGNLVASTGSFSADVKTRWQSSWQDTVTGLYYVIARWYSPTLERFVSEDPLKGDTMRPQTRELNRPGNRGDSRDRV